MLLPHPLQGPESWSRPLCKTGWMEIHPGVPSSPGWGWSAGSLGRCKQRPPSQPWALPACVRVCACVLCAQSSLTLAQSSLTLCNTLDCSPPGSSVPGILQARILEWVAISSAKGSSGLWEGTTASGTSPALQADVLQLSHWGTEGNGGCWAKCLETQEEIQHLK